MSKTEVHLAVHGGAWNIPDNLWQAHHDGCARAHKAGMKILNEGGTALDAVCTAIRIMEDDPTYDAGYGSFLNRDGKVELDAGVMEGRNLESGAVLGVSRIKNPIDLARHVLEDTDHCIFLSHGAHELAAAAGFTMIDPETHIHPREAEVYARIQAGDTSILETAWASPQDTVGAVAMDMNGDLAAGNSTGGTLMKAPGRVGDAPLISSGFYADNHLGAVVCTGWGESIMRSGIAMRALHYAQDDGPQVAAKRAISFLKERVGGFGGILILTPDGRSGYAHNTERMAALGDSFSSWDA